MHHALPYAPLVTGSVQWQHLPRAPVPFRAPELSSPVPFPYAHGARGDHPLGKVGLSSIGVRGGVSRRPAATAALLSFPRPGVGSTWLSSAGREFQWSLSSTEFDASTGSVRSATSMGARFPNDPWLMLGLLRPPPARTTVNRCCPTHPSFTPAFALRTRWRGRPAAAVSGVGAPGAGAV